MLRDSTEILDWIDSILDPTLEGLQGSYASGFIMLEMISQVRILRLLKMFITQENFDLDTSGMYKRAKQYIARDLALEPELKRLEYLSGILSCLERCYYGKDSKLSNTITECLHVLDMTTKNMRLQLKRNGLEENAVEKL